MVWVVKYCRMMERVIFEFLVYNKYISMINIFVNKGNNVKDYMRMKS